jgi:hypothetical protein
MASLLLSSLAFALLTLVVLFRFEVADEQRGIDRHVLQMSRMTAAVVTAALASGSAALDPALGTLASQPRARSGAVYDPAGRLPARYPADTTAIPSRPGADGYTLEDGHLRGFTTLRSSQGPLGTLYFDFDRTIDLSR